MENFPHKIQMQLSKQPIIFYQFLIAFLEYTSNFQMKLIAQRYSILLTLTDLVT